jgi:hypothetical protein
MIFLADVKFATFSPQCVEKSIPQLNFNKVGCKLNCELIVNTVDVADCNHGYYYQFCKAPNTDTTNAFLLKMKIEGVLVRLTMFYPTNFLLIINVIPVVTNTYYHKLKNSQL